ncbi:MAG: trypsin-like peptidase domain-containing protein, partial [Deltaproteobacteria bacterium]
DGKLQPAQFECGWGSAFSIVSDKYIVTAFHVLNDGKPRDPSTKFYALVVPGNGDPFFTFPVVAFPIERQVLDIAVLEIGPCSTAGIHLPALPVSFVPQTDGTEVLTMGFPAPEIAGLNADPQGNFLGGQFFLKSHANEGIVAAQYILNVPGVANNPHFYELNVAWHHGESGGPIVTATDQPVVFSLMQHYRNVQGPNGVLPGPRRGIALSAIRRELGGLGVVGV